MKLNSNTILWFLVSWSAAQQCAPILHIHDDLTYAR